MTILSVIGALLLLCLIILIHELGHFLVGRAVGLRVDEFFIGFGPKLIKWGKGETEYSIRLLPLGGACVFHGEDEDNPNDPTAMNNQPVWKRIVTIAAGPVMNFVSAFLLTIILLVGVGLPSTIATVDTTIPDSAAEEAGLLPGDRIVAINGQEVEGNPQTASSLIQESGENPAQFVIDRDGETMEFTITPQIGEEGRPMIGIYFAVVPDRMPLWEGIKTSFSFQVEIMQVMLTSLRDLFFAGEGVDDVMGPVGTVALISSYAQEGLVNILYLLILISINVGIFNLLPIPALDGSRLVFLIIEAIRRKPIDPNKEAVVHLIGFVLLIGLMLVFTYKDIMRLITGGGI